MRLRFLRASSSMTTTATNLSSSAGIALVLVSLMVGTSCSEGSYEPMFTAKSPDGAFVAQVERMEEGTFGSTRYRLSVSRADGTEAFEAFRGENGWVSQPVWQNASTLLVPFCFGSISFVDSVLPLNGSEAVHYRESSSTSIRVHIVTAPSTSVAEATFCPIGP